MELGNANDGATPKIIKKKKSLKSHIVRIWKYFAVELLMLLYLVPWIMTLVVSQTFALEKVRKKISQWHFI